MVLRMGSTMAADGGVGPFFLVRGRSARPRLARPIGFGGRLVEGHRCHRDRAEGFVEANEDRGPGDAKGRRCPQRGQGRATVEPTEVGQRQLHDAEDPLQGAVDVVAGQDLDEDLGQKRPSLR